MWEVILLKVSKNLKITEIGPFEKIATRSSTSAEAHPIHLVTIMILVPWNSMVLWLNSGVAYTNVIVPFFFFFRGKERC